MRGVSSNRGEPRRQRAIFNRESSLRPLMRMSAEADKRTWLPWTLSCWRFFYLSLSLKVRTDPRPGFAFFQLTHDDNIPNNLNYTREAAREAA
jgi:hypothetical protein